MATTTPRPIPAQTLPHEPAQFIAYGRNERIAHPKTGEAVTVRAQVYARYYPEITIKELLFGGINGDSQGLLTVDFDPRSVPGGLLKKPIRAHLDDDDPTVALLREAHEAQRPVAICIETQRKKKNATTRAPITALPHIHGLRGAADASGAKSGAMQDASHASTSNKLALIDGVPTKHLLSNPMEWAALVQNKDGSLPPEGWLNFAVGDTWQECGAAIKDGDAQDRQSAPAGASLDVGSMQQMIESTLRKILAEQTAQGSGSGTGERPHGKFFEGKPWDPRTSDGRVNLGWYVVSAEKWAFHWAYEHLVSLARDETTEADEDEAWELAGAVMAFADQAQASAYGHGFEIDRASTSHREAEDWVKWTIKHQHPWSEREADQQAWAQAVIDVAAGHLSRAGQRAGEYLASKAKLPPSQQPAPEPVPSGPSEALTQSVVDAVTRFWNNPEAIANLAGQAQEKGLGQLPVAPAMENGVVVGVLLASSEDAHAAPLLTALRSRWEALKAQQQGSQQGAAAAQQETTAAPAAQPQQDGQRPQETAEQADPSQQAQAPQQAPQQAQQAPQGSPQEGDLVQGYPAPLGHAIGRVHVAQRDGDMQALHAAYEAAKAGGFVGATIFTATDPRTGAVVFGENNDHREGFGKQTLGAAIGLVRDHLSADSQQGQQGQQGQPEQNTQDPAATQKAQAIADQVTTTMDAQAVQELSDSATGLLDTLVTVQSISGNAVTTKLGSYLSTTLRKAQRAAAASQ